MIYATLKRDHEESFKTGDTVQVFGFFWHTGDGLYAVIIANHSFTHVPARDLAPLEEESDITE